VPDRPLLKLPDPRSGERQTLSPAFSPPPPELGPERQGRRQTVGGRLERLRRTLASPPALQPGDDDIAPERTLVFDVGHDIDGFLRAAERAGMEYIAEDASDSEPDEDFAVGGGRLYLVMPSHESLEQMLRLWDIWRRRGTIPRGFTPWRDVFSHLREIRRWGPADRLPQQTINYITALLEEDGDADVLLEIELIFRTNDDIRAESFESFSGQASGFGATVLDHAVISEIRYEGVLIELSAYNARHLIENPSEDIAGIEEVMHISPSSAASVYVSEEIRSRGEAFEPDVLAPPHCSIA